MRSFSVSGVVALAVLLAAPAPLWAHGFGGRGWGRGGFRGGFYRGGHLSRHYGYSRPYYRPHYRPYSYRYSYPRYYGYSYPSFGFYGSFGGFGLGFGYAYGPSYYYWPSPSVYYVPSYPIIIEREAVRIREVDRESTRSASAERYWLIAFRDKSITAVTDYWLEDSTLRYVTRQGTASSADLSDIDLSFTKELNRERGLEFRLPRSSDSSQPRRLDSFGRPY